MHFQITVLHSIPSDYSLIKLAKKCFNGLQIYEDSQICTDFFTYLIVMVFQKCLTNLNPLDPNTGPYGSLTGFDFLTLFHTVNFCRFGVFSSSELEIGSFPSKNLLISPVKDSFMIRHGIFGCLFRIM